MPCFARSIYLNLMVEILRREPLEKRKALLAKLLKGSPSSIVLNEHYEEEGEIVFREACKLGCEGSCPSGSARFIAGADPRFGSRSKIRMRQP